MREPVKGKSDAGRRREQRARQTRQRIVEAALRLFLERGYVATTVEAIAREAGVAAATVYQAFGTKPAILARTLDVAVAGDAAPMALLDRDWVRRARAEPDAHRRLAMVIENASAVAARTAPVKEVIRDAAGVDPAAGALVRQDHERRYVTQQGLVHLVISGADLRPGINRASAVATFFALVNSDTYRLLVGHLGWPVEDWRAWLVRMLDREFFESETAPASSAQGQQQPRRR